MSDEKTFPTRTPDLFAEDSPASLSATQGSSEHRTTPATSGRKCLDLSGNVGPLGLLEKTLLDSSNWAWTKYSLTWKAKATPQGRLIFQLARSAPRTSAKGSGLLHTPTAKANQMAPSMATRDSGSWGLGGAKPHHMVPTPTSQDHIKRKSTNTTPSTGKLNYETNKSVSLDRWVEMWPTPNAREKGGGDYQDPEKIKARIAKGHQTNLGDMVKLWPTPTAMTGGDGVAPSHKEGKHGWNIGAAAHDSLSDNPNQMWPTPRAASGGPGKNPNNPRGIHQGNPLATAVQMWPTPRKSMAKGPTSREVNSGKTKGRLENAVQLWPTPSANEDAAGTPNGKMQRMLGNHPEIRGTTPEQWSRGQLNPTWVAWLMGYPTEYLSCVPWETRSSRRSRKK